MKDIFVYNKCLTVSLPPTDMRKLAFEEMPIYPASDHQGNSGKDLQ